MSKMTNWKRSLIVCSLLRRWNAGVTYTYTADEKENSKITVITYGII